MLDIPTVEMDDLPVTVYVTRKIRPDRVAEFERLLDQAIKTANKFPGYLGVTVFRPNRPRDHEYLIVFKFDKLSALLGWENSEERKKFHASAESLQVAPTQTSRITGFEAWFTLPQRPGLSPPPRYKMTLVTMLAAFPMLAMLGLTLGPALLKMPLLLRCLIQVAILIPAMSYVVMPTMTRLFAKWLYPKEPKGNGIRFDVQR